MSRALGSVGDAATGARAGRAENARGRLLDAAETVAGREGLGQLSLDLVAKEAGVTKAGLLYHFPSKEALIRAMIDRMVVDMLARWRERAAADPRPGPTALAMAAISLAFEPDGEFVAFAERVTAVMLAAVVFDRALTEPLRVALEETSQEVMAALPPHVGPVLIAALDGIWMARMFDLYPLEGPRGRALRHALEAMVSGADPAPAVPGG